MLRRAISTSPTWYKMPAPKKRKDGPKQKKAPPKAVKLTMLEVRKRYMEETPPLPYHAYPDERCFLEKYKRSLVHLSDEESNYRIELGKDYARFMNNYWAEVKNSHKRQMDLQDRALKHLQSTDANLFSTAIELDFDQFPNSKTGLKETLPNPQHTAPLKVSRQYLENEEAVGTNSWLEEEKESRAEKFKQKAKKNVKSSLNIASSVKL